MEHLLRYNTSAWEPELSIHKIHLRCFFFLPLVCPSIAGGAAARDGKRNRTDRERKCAYVPRWNHPRIAPARPDAMSPGMVIIDVQGGTAPYRDRKRQAQLTEPFGALAERRIHPGGHRQFHQTLAMLPDVQRKRGLRLFASFPGETPCIPTSSPPTPTVTSLPAPFPCALQHPRPHFAGSHADGEFSVGEYRRGQSRIASLPCAQPVRDGREGSWAW